MDQPEQDEQPSLFDDPNPDYTDASIWVEVRTPELLTLVEHAGTENECRWEVLSGRYLTSHRQRTEADGSAAFVVEKPLSKVKPSTEEKMQWPKWGEGEPNRVDPRVLRKYHKDAPAYHPAGALGFGSLSFQGRNNQNVE